MLMQVREKTKQKNSMATSIVTTIDRSNEIKWEQADDQQNCFI